MITSLPAVRVVLQNGYSCARGGASFNNLPASLSSPALSKVYQYASKHLLRCYPGGALLFDVENILLLLRLVQARPLPY
jgi:hypothetical protein